MRILWTLVLIIASLFIAADGKVVRGKVSLSTREPMRYMDKFGYDVGSGTYRIRLKLISPKRFADRSFGVHTNIFVDDKYESSLHLNPCARSEFSSVSKNITVRYNEWSAPMYGRLTQRLRPHMWYMTLDRCDLDSSLSSFRVQYEIEFQQEGGSQFSVEHRSHFWLTGLSILFLTGLFGFTLFRSIKSIEQGEKMHVVLQFLNGALTLHLAANIAKFIHYWSYSNDGDGIYLFDMLGGGLHFVAEASVLALLILMGMGFSFVHPSVRSLKKRARAAVVGVLALQAVLSIVSALGRDDRYEFSEHEGVTGWILTLLRVLIVAWHVYNCQMTVKQSAASNSKQARFIEKFMIASTIYMLLWPFLYAFSESCLAPYNRLRFVRFVGICAAMGLLFWLSRLFVGRKSQYFQVSTMSSSFLPGAFIGQMVHEVDWLKDTPLQGMTLPASIGAAVSSAFGGAAPHVPQHYQQQQQQTQQFSNFAEQKPDQYAQNQYGEQQYQQQQQQQNYGQQQFQQQTQQWGSNSGYDQQFQQYGGSVGNRKFD